MADFVAEKPRGVILIASVLGLLGIAAIASNVAAVALSMNRAPLGVVVYGVLCGAAALLCAVLLWRRHKLATKMFLVWSAGFLAAWVIFPQGLDLKYMPSLLFAVALVYFGHRYIARYVEGGRDSGLQSS